MKKGKMTTKINTGVWGEGRGGRRQREHHAMKCQRIVPNESPPPFLLFYVSSAE
jgi:hypothetical protein